MKVLNVQLKIFFIAPKTGFYEFLSLEEEEIGDFNQVTYVKFLFGEFVKRYLFHKSFTATTMRRCEKLIDEATLFTRIP